MRRAIVGLVVALLAEASAGFAVSGAGGNAGSPVVDSRDLTAFVHPLAGTLGAGFPMVGGYVPFSMIQPGPATGYPGVDDPFTYDGYMYEDPTIHGFSLTHFAGAGIHISGDLPFMPTTGSVSSTDHTRYASPYDHLREVAQPGYYAVTLDRYQVRTELTATMHAGFMRFTFPATAQSNILLAASESLYGNHLAHVDVGTSSLTGWILSRPAADCVAQHQCYKLWFDAEFDRPFRSVGTWNGATLTPGSRSVESTGAGTYLSFDTTAKQVVQMRVGISYVDAAGAAANLAAEIPAGTSFDSVRRAAHDAWNARLHDVEVSGGEPGQLQTFYSNLYAALGMPTTFDDADGRYLGFDDVVRTIAPGHHHYMNLSIWDVYRSQNPLLELIEPDVARDVMLSLLDDYDQDGQVLPRWVQANLDYGIMGGDSATPVLADGVMRGLLRGTDATRAYAAMLHQATTLPPVSSRGNLDAYLHYGYIPEDVSDIGASKTQEYDIDDAALLQVARMYGTPQDVAMLTPRTELWHNLVYPGAFAGDPHAHFIRPRNRDGSWANPPNTLGQSEPWSPEFQYGYSEGTGWQYLWAEPQDVAGLAAAEGGAAVTISRLDTFFSSALAAVPYVVPTAQEYGSAFGVYYVGNQYTPGNEPDLWAPWYYDWLGQPWKTQDVVRAEMRVYNSRPDGLPGNEDAGEINAWYVLAALGIYPVTPGVPVFALNSPSFATVVIHLGSNGAFTIRAPGTPVLDKYIQSAHLDGTAYSRTYLTQCDLRPGGALDYSLGATPNPSWGTGPGAAPPSLSDGQPAAAVQACIAALRQ